jgi:hypothetical protein
MTAIKSILCALSARQSPNTYTFLYLNPYAKNVIIEYMRYEHAKSRQTEKERLELEKRNHQVREEEEKEEVTQLGPNITLRRRPCFRQIKYIDASTGKEESFTWNPNDESSDDDSDDEDDIL